MKKITALTVLLLSAVLSFVLVSCKGDKGSAGPTGPVGSMSIYFQDLAFPNTSYAGETDAGIASLTPTFVYGSGCSDDGVGYDTTYSMGKARSLIRFDLGSYLVPIPTVTGAKLILNIDQVYGTITFKAYELTHAWALGTNCVAAQAGYACWNDYGAAGWTTAGGDYDPTPVSDAITVTSPGYGVLTLNAAIVQKWLNTPATNYGLILIAENETTDQNSIYFNRSNYTFPPRLTVYYQP
jgi:hypothetical protein